MKYLGFLRNFRTKSNLIKRFLKIINRYGFNSTQLKKNITQFIFDCNNFGICPTFPVTAQVLKRHSDFFMQFDPEQAEFAVHGYYHQDYTRISNPKKKEQLQQALDVFRNLNIPVTGFRFPYLRVDEISLYNVAELSFEYDSSFVYWWDIFDIIPAGSEDIIQKMKYQYEPRQPEMSPILPERISTLIEIPVSIPDDDILVDRLGILDNDIIFTIWKAILDQTIERGEIFVLQLHPERYHLLRKALLKLLGYIYKKKEEIWATPLREIASWWKRREEIQVSCIFTGKNRIRIQIKRPRELNYQFYNYESEKNVKFVLNRSSNLLQEEFEIKMPCLPLIGVGEKTTPSFRELLKNAGFVIEEEMRSREDFCLFFDEDPDMDSPYQWLRQFTMSLNIPLLKFNVWPGNFKCAFAVTGDIDALSTQDFFSRIYDH